MSRVARLQFVVLNVRILTIFHIRALFFKNSSMLLRVKR